MPNIPYPNVPPLPGVPPLSRTGEQFLGEALTRAGEFIPLDLFGQKFAIIDSNTKENAITPDSFVSFELKHDQKIPIYPMQDGAFSSYNKVGMPFDIKLTVTCGGNLQTSKKDFLDKINFLLTSLTLVDIVTPDRVYNDTNLIHVDYRREAKQGATLLIAQLWFQWVRIVSSTTQTAEPSGESSVSNGQVSPQTPSSENASNGISSSSAGDIQ